MIMSSTTNQHFRDMPSLRRRPRMISTQAVIARSAALLVLVVLMDSPQLSIAEQEPLPTYGSDEPPAADPPPASVRTPPADSQNPTPSLPPPVLTPPASRNPTPSPPPPKRSVPDSQQQAIIDPPSVEPPPPESVEKVEVWAHKYPATDFRDESVPRRFELWPDSLPYVKFVYFCQQTVIPPKRLLEKFKIKDIGEGILQTRPYFDLGLVDRYNTPYFRRWSFDWRVDIHRISCPVICEYTNLQRLYEYRLRRNVLATGFGYGVAALAILELAVMVFIILHWLVIRRKVGATEDQTLKECPSDCYMKSLEEHWTDFIPDWIHLVHLCMVGFAMMEGAGHSNFFEWRSMLFYNTGITYTYLTLSAMLSSFLYQCALFLQNRKPAAAHLTHSSSVSRTASKRTTQVPTTNKDDELKNSQVKGVVLWTDDWKYQRMFGQTGVLILMGMYLLSVDDKEGKNMDSLASVIAGAIIVACIWSFAVTTVVAMRSLRCIFLTIWPKKPIKPSAE